MHKTRGAFFAKPSQYIQVSKHYRKHTLTSRI